MIAQATTKGLADSRAAAEVSFYSSLQKSPTKDIPIREVVRIIREGDLAEAVGHVRAAVERGRVAITEDEKERAENQKAIAKKRLPAVQISGRVTQGERGQAFAQGRFEHSGWLQLDIDGDDLNGRTPEEARKILGDDPHILSAFITPSGEGVKGLFKVKQCTNEAEHKAVWIAGENYIRETYGFKLDAATKDAGRLCFLSADAACTWQPLAVEFVPAVVAAPAATPFRELPRYEPATSSRIIHSKVFPEPPTNGIHIWTMEAAWWCRLHGGMTEAETVAKLQSYNGSLRRSLQPSEAADTARKVFAQPPEGGGAAQPTKPRTDPETLRQQAYAMRFDPQEVPPPDETCMMLGDAPIAARGNLSVIQGKSKVGKSALIAAVLGAAQRGDYYSEADTICASWEGPCTGAIVHLDTEQSRFDWHNLVLRSVTRSGLQEVSPRLVSLPLVMFARSERLEILRQTLAHELAIQGTIDAVILDGIADLCLSPNDEGEALELVSQIHALSQEFNTAIFCVLHENPSAMDGKTRGHLGSELNRKAFANLRIDKDDEGVSTVYGTDMRKRDIPKTQGFCFAWDDAAKMHTYRGRAGGIKAAKIEKQATEKAREEWEAIFEERREIGTNLTCPDLTAEEAAVIERGIKGTKKLTTTDAMKKRMQRAESLGVLRKTKPGVWTLKPSGQTGQIGTI